MIPTVTGTKKVLEKVKEIRASAKVVSDLSRQLYADADKLVTVDLKFLADTKRSIHLEEAGPLQARLAAAKAALIAAVNNIETPSQSEFAALATTLDPVE